MGDPSIERRSLEGLSADLASGGSGMGAGVGCASTCALAAALVALVARASPDWAEGNGVAAQAVTLGARAQEMADADAQAFATALTALDEARVDRGEGLGP